MKYKIIKSKDLIEFMNNINININIDNGFVPYSNLLFVECWYIQAVIYKEK